MNAEWIIIEAIAVLVESLAVIYFLNSRFKSKYENSLSQWLAWTLLVVWGLIYVFAELPVNDYLGTCITYGIGFVYLCVAKRSRLIYKVFGIVLVLALSLAITLAGAGLATLIIGESIEHMLLDQDGCRLLTIILVKTMQVVIFYIISKKQKPIHALGGKLAVLLICAVALVFSCLLVIFLNISAFDAQTTDVMAWIATGLLIILVGVFYMYEVFVQKEARNILLHDNLQRLEQETQYFRELDVIYSDLRTWRHEYKNNLLALRALIANESTDKAVEYLDNIKIDSVGENTTLQTGNLVLDTIVSAKLRFAQSIGINVDVQIVYPENNCIAINELCAIVGNLLDNAIEACERMDDELVRFISFSLLVKGKNLAIYVSNSYNGEIVQEGKSYLTSKNKGTHGIGIQYVDSIVEKNKGHIMRKHNSGVFETYVLLPLITNPGEHKDNAIND